MWERLENQLT